MARSSAMVTMTRSETLLPEQKNLSLTLQGSSSYNRPQNSLNTLPTELVLQVLEYLPPNSRLCLRATTCRFAAIFHNLLDPEIFKTVHIRLTNKSITGLQDLTRNSSLAAFVTTLVFDTNRLLPVQTIEHFRRVLCENDLCRNLLSDPKTMRIAFAEYQKLYYEQTRLLSVSEDVLAEILPKFSNLSTVVIDTAENWSLKGKDFDGAGHVAVLRDFELAPAFLEMALVEHNTHTFLSIASGVAAAGVAIKNWVVKSGVLFKGLRWDVFSIDAVSAGLKGAQNIELCVDNSECKAPKQHYFGLMGGGLPSSADSMVAVLREAAASKLKVLKITVVNRADAEGWVFTDVPCLKQFLPESQSLEELWVGGIGCKVGQLGNVLMRNCLMKVVFTGCCVAEFGMGGWEEVVVGLRGKGVQVGLERAVLLEKTARQGSWEAVSGPGQGFALGDGESL